MKKPTSREAAAYLLAVALLGANAMAAADTFFPDRLEFLYAGAGLLLAGIGLLALAIVAGE